MRRFFTLTAAALVLGLALPALALAQRIPKHPPSPPPPATSLEMTVTTGDVEQWQTDTVINVAKPYSFRWKTAAEGVTGATWQVTDAATAKVIGSGAVSGPFQAGAYYRLPIDFKPVLPAQPGDQLYSVSIRPQAKGQNIPESSLVLVKYAKPDGKVVALDDISLDQAIDRFEKNLRAELDHKTVGYEYAVYVGQTQKKAGAGGYANLDSELKMSPDQRMVVASMSKTITAAAVMRALEIKGPNAKLTDPVAPFLPSDWVLGPHMDTLSFQDLLQHRSGFRGANGGNGDDGPGDDGSFDGLRQAMATGSTDANWQVYQYHNANFALFRLIIPYLMNAKSDLEVKDGPFAATYDPQKLAVRTGKLYVKFVQDNVLTPAGLSGVGVGSSAPMMYYNFNDLSKTWGGYSDDYGLTHCGANCWVLSAKEYGTFLTALQHGKIVSDESFHMMEIGQLGMRYADPPPPPPSNPFSKSPPPPPNPLYTYGGPNWNHNGKLTNAFQGDWMILPKGVTVVVLVNSWGGLNQQTEQLIPPAWNAAW